MPLNTESSDNTPADTPKTTAASSTTDTAGTADTAVSADRPGIPYFQAALMDILAVLLFALLARIAHNSPDFPFSWTGVLETAWPFLLGAAAGFGVMAILRKPAGDVVPTGLTVWISSVVIGLLIWGLRHGEVPHWSFMIVAGSVSAILILGWRGLAKLSGRVAAKRRAKKAA